MTTKPGWNCRTPSPSLATTPTANCLGFNIACGMKARGGRWGGGRGGGSKGNQGGEEGPGRIVALVVRQQNAVESRKGETALYVSIAIPTFLGCSGWKDGKGMRMALCAREFYTCVHACAAAIAWLQIILDTDSIWEQ